uniref:Uncharacterized protein n=1 Tax=Anguilla anguilla TaxID=7936 RepID=A0A0E9T078_ANGAN
MEIGWMPFACDEVVLNCDAQTLILNHFQHYMAFVNNSFVRIM